MLPWYTPEARSGGPRPDQNDLVRLYLGYESDDYEETGHALYGASVFKAYCQVPELRVVYRLDSAMHCWLVGDDGPVPDRTPSPRSSLSDS